MKTAFKKFGVALLAFGVLLPSQQAWCEPDAPTEYQIKAAFLYNFVKFVEWPGTPASEPSASFVIGIFGDDPFGDDLTDELAGKSVDGKSLMLKHPATLQEAADCNVLFISAAERVRLAVILEGLRGHSVLTVSDIPRFIQKGGMIGFSLDDHRIRFSINRAATTAAHLVVSSQLLKLAKTVRE